jgi:uncharacterized protein (TIGR00661 family)
MSKILYAIQATGNGHLSRAREMIPHLMNYGQLDVLVSGTESDVSVPYFIKYKKKGLSYKVGTKGGVDMVESIKKLKPFDFFKDIRTLPVENYDVVINDFEPVSAWACKLKHKPCVALSHQSAYLSSKTPRPSKKNAPAEWIFRNYAPCSLHYGFHFKAYDDNIYTPIIREEVRILETSQKEHITVYLPSQSDEQLHSIFSKVKWMKWEVFSKHAKQPFQKDNVSFAKINNNDFLKSLAASSGIITGGGFESPAEAMYLKKKVMVIPMKNQYEQQCNAVAAKQLGVTVVNEINNSFAEKLNSWLRFAEPVEVNYTDQTAYIIDKMMHEAL